MRTDPVVMLERLRSLRNGRGPDLTIGGSVGVEQQRLAKQARVERGLARAWIAHVPQAIADRIQPVSLRAGVLTVRSTDASSDYRFSQWLRAGGQRELARLTGKPIRRVRTIF